MKIVARLFVAGAAAALVYWVWVIGFPPPAKVVEKRLNALARAVSFGSRTGGLAKLHGAQSIPDFFAVNARVSIDIPGREALRLSGRDAIGQAALAARTADGLSVALSDVAVKVAPDNESATAEVLITARAAGGSGAFVEPATFVLLKTDGEWLITQISAESGPVR